LLKTEAPTLTDSSGPTQRRVVLKPGDSFGHYRIVRLLGAGGMGEVFEAEETPSGRRVALKLMGHTLGSEEDRRRFLREGRLAASVNHPNVVYVHGSEEIDGVPVITMELAPAGTLKDQLKKLGVLPVAEAVESILQVIDGLEAASAAGVLHRDIKPANCFLANDGLVKIGDFGLSVSTLARGESLLTANGAILGTPAYAAPEQLRGEELDVRADIYSLGATLYHLLTGKTPFSATDFVKLITEVLDKEPARPEALRADLPRDLSKVLLRCLAKDRHARFQSYAELRHALIPFGRIVAEPARPSRRFLAGLLDELIAYGPSMAFLAYLGTDPLDYFTRERTWSTALVWMVFILWYVVYYGVAEGLWGAALGKAALGLRVVGRDQQRPGIARAMARTVIYLIPYCLPYFLLMAFASKESIAQAQAENHWIITDYIWPITWAMLFLTMRRRNGYAALHDLLTHTRVVIRPKIQIRPALDNATSPPLSSTALTSAPASFGPYPVVAPLWTSSGQALWLATDPVLRRQVWIHVQPSTAQPISSARRDLARPGRLRWLNAGTTTHGTWDAYEAVDGAPFVEVARQNPPWNAWRFWLLDLAEELAAELNQSESKTTAAMDRIWISNRGRALLLDFPCPGLGTENAAKDAPTDWSTQGIQWFLYQCAQRVQEAAGRPSTVPLPAQGFLANLARRGFEKPEFVVGNLHSLVNKPAELSRAWRAGSLALVPIASLVLAVEGGLIVNFEQVRWDRAWYDAYPTKPSLRVAATVYENAVQGAERAEDLELERAYLATHFGELLTNETFWTYPRLGASLGQRDLLRQTFTQLPTPSAQTIRDADRTMERKMNRQIRIERRTVAMVSFTILVMALCLFPLVSLASAWIFAVNPIHRLFGIAAINIDGARASRWRLTWRWFCAWPFFIMLAAAGTILTQMPNLEPNLSNAETLRAIGLAMLGGTMLLMLVAAIHAALHPQRSLADRGAGTWLVRS
jgi:hypothetical protein